MKFLSGTVYSKALAIFLAASLVLLGAVAALTQLIIFREFNLTEQREMKAMLQRFMAYMAREVKPLEVTVGEWSRADVPFGKINSEDLTDLGIDFVVLYDGEGRIVRMVGAEQAIVGLLRGGEKVTAALEQASDELPSEENRTGNVLIEGRLCVLAVFSIPSSKPGDSRGMLVGGKFFGPGAWGFLEGLFSATIKFNTFSNSSGSTVTGGELVDLLNSQEIVIDSDDSSQITGYRLIKGLNGRPLGYVSIAQPRPLRQEGLRAIQVFLTGICLAGGALVIVVWILLDRTILARIKDLTRKLDAEKRSGRLPVRLDFAGDDEMGALARSIEDLAVLLQSAQFQYKAVVEDQTEMICRFDADGNLSFANQVFLRMFQMEDQPMEGKAVRDILPENAANDFAARFQRLSPEKPLTTYTHEVSFTPGVLSWFRSTLRKNFSSEGNCQGGQWVAADITAQIAAQRQTLESEQRFRRLFETASDGILLVEREKLIISDINPSLCRMLMLAGSGVMGRALEEIAVFGPCLDIVNFYRRAEAGSTRRAPFRNECRLERGDGSALYIELKCSGYEVDGGQFVQMNFRNISDRVLGERELRKLSAKLLRLQDEERRRIARELHDSTAQNLSALEMNMSLLEPMLGSSLPKASRLVAETRQIAGECSRELRNISYLLHPPLIDEVGLAFAIKWFADGFAKRTGIAATVEIEEGFPRLESDIEMPLFRVVQEAMTNIYRHSGADHAWVSLQRQGNIVSLEIRDNGCGFEGEVLIDEDGAEILPEIRPGVGLAGMRERLANLGGRLDIENSPLGVTISIRLTLDHLHASSDT